LIDGNYAFASRLKRTEYQMCVVTITLQGVTASRLNEESTMTTGEEGGIEIVCSNFGRNRVTARAIT